MSAKKLPATLEETGEIHRDKCRQVIYRALADEVPAPDEPESPTSPTKLGSKACAIEEEM
ncbi:hypothetical protein HK097_003885 [Rhizophlyctis rosea]|uniref:TFIIS central domain-containing protein n=1 Tax=Rhizophlyctis rosea TaxID=64517 RepID=A0AAD5S277_9FUNG|nr:hypothetical protein HK097_003885 [Rhizophlyctis rosea]